MQKRHLFVILIMCILTTTVAYSGLSTSLAITSEAIFRPTADIRITNIELESAKNNALEQYKSKYTKNTTTVGIKLPNTTSEITYKVTVENRGDIDQTIYEIITQSTNNSNVKYEIKDYKEKDIIGFKEEKTFLITFKNESPTEEITNIVLKYDFRKVYKVEYDSNGGEKAPESQNKYEKEDLKITEEEAVKEGNIFKGWTDEKESKTVKYEKGSTYTLDKNILLYAVWEKGIYENTISHWAGGFKNKEGNNNTTTKTAYKLNITNFKQEYKTTYKMDETKKIEIPNGYSLHSNFGTSSIDGSWKNYTLGTEVVQKGSTMHYEYYYYPIDYNITYNLNGGINNSENPKTYNVLYGVTFKNPSKKGYTFEGWSKGEDILSKYEITAKYNAAINGNKITFANTTSGNTLNAFKLQLNDTAFNYIKTMYSYDLNSHLNIYTHTNDTGNYNVRVKANGTTQDSYYSYKNVYLEKGKTYIIDYTVGAFTSSKIEISNLTMKEAVTGINEGENATFTSVSDLYSKLKTRTTGDKTLTAQWTPNTYEVTLDSQGATSSGTTKYYYQYNTGKTIDGVQTYYYKDSGLSEPLLTNITVPTKTGYTFKGYYTEKEGKGTQYVNETGGRVNNLYQKSANNITLYAYWTANTYTVSYNANGGSGTTASSSHTYDVSKALTSNGFTRAGYTFAGWATSASGSVVYSNGQSVKNLTATKGATVTLYAKWTLNTYSLSVNPNGGSFNGSTSSVSYTQNYNTLKVLPKPTRTGYTFKGWTKVDGGTLSTYGNPLFNDETFASGTNKFSVYNNAGGGTVTHSRIATTSDNPMKNTSYMMQIKTTGTASPGLGGFCQSTQSKANGVFYHIIVAKIPKGYNINQANNSTGTGSSFTWLTSRAGTGNFETYIYKANNGSSGTFSNFGHVYITGTAATSSSPVTWYVAYANMFDATSGTSNRNVSQVYTFTGSNSLTAEWEANEYTVTYNLNYGTGNESVGIVTYGSTYGTLPTPTRTGYTFDGWYTAASGGTKITSSTKYTTASDQTIYAHWTANTYTVSYNANGGSGSTASSSHTYDASKALTSNGFTKNGYTFAGWATSASGSVVYSNGQSVKNLTATKGATVTLYAKWTANKIKLTLNGNGGTLGTNAVWYYYGTSKFYSNEACTSQITKITLPTRTGYTYSMFTGDGTSGGNKDERYIHPDGSFASDLATDIYKNATLTAQWTANKIKLTLNGNGGTLGTSAVWYYYGTSKFYSNEACTSQITKITLPTRTGYTYSMFTGDGTSGGNKGERYTNADGSFTGDLATDIYKNATLTAQWTAKTYTVSYNANGGSVSPSSTTVTYNSTYGTLATPTRTDYRFDGWYTAASGGTKITSSTKVTITANQTIYAHWTQYTAKNVTGSTTKYYTSLNSALNEASTTVQFSTTTTLLKNTSETINITQPIIRTLLNMNGKTITGVFINNNTSASISIGNGTITNSKDRVIYNAGVMNITSGTYTGSYSGYGEKIYNVKSGTMNISGGTFINNVNSIDSQTIYNAGTMNVTGGTIQTGTGWTVRNSGTFKMSGGTIKLTTNGSTGTALYNDVGGVVTTTGGTIESAGFGFVNNGSQGTDASKLSSLSKTTISITYSKGYHNVLNRENSYTYLKENTIKTSSTTGALLYNDTGILVSWNDNLMNARPIQGIVYRYWHPSQGRVQFAVFGRSDITSFPTWTSKNGQDDIKWYSPQTYTDSVMGTYKYVDIYTSNHNNESGEYNTHIYAGSTFVYGFSYTMP